METGRVKKLFSTGEDPYGFIIPDGGGRDVYFKLSRGRAFVVEGEGCVFTDRDVEYNVLKGDRVMFETKECGKGPQAERWALLPKSVTGTSPQAAGGGFPPI